MGAKLTGDTREERYMKQVNSWRKRRKGQGWWSSCHKELVRRGTCQGHLARNFGEQQPFCISFQLCSLHPSNTNPLHWWGMREDPKWRPCVERRMMAQEGVQECSQPAEVKMVSEKKRHKKHQADAKCVVKSSSSAIGRNGHLPKRPRRTSYSQQHRGKWG